MTTSKAHPVRSTRNAPTVATQNSLPFLLLGCQVLVFGTTEHLHCFGTYLKVSVPEKLSVLIGNWRGVNRLHMPWNAQDPLHESQATAEVRTRSGGQILEIAYTWNYEDTLREGVLQICCEGKGSAVTASWTDSWHLAHQLMHCEGLETENGGISVTGAYKVAEHPDWGWRTEIVPGSDSFRYLMFNISPRGEEDLAVEMELSAP